MRHAIWGFIVAGFFLGMGHTFPAHPAQGRVWPVVSVNQFQAFTQVVGAAHICTHGMVLREPIKEADGDYHVRLGPNVPRSVKQPFVVLVIIPELPLPLPPVKTMIEACGIIRYDQKHEWWELHPLLRWIKQ